MKRAAARVLTILLIGILLLGAPRKGAANGDELKLTARAFVELLAREDFTEAVKSFGPPLNSSLPAEELGKTWKSILAKRGTFKGILNIQTGRVEEYGGQRYDVVIVHCQLERAQIDVRISFNHESQITSLWFVRPEKTDN